MVSISRRNFLSRSAAALAAGAILGGRASTAAGNGAKPAASNVINIGVIGLHNQGWWDALSLLKGDPAARITALCDVDRPLLAKRAAELGERQRAFGREERPAALLCEDYRRLLERKDVDVVFIGTPDHWHCRQFVDAAEAGKDIYVQKPFANSIAECDVMVAAARRHRRVVQVGQQQRGGAYWRELVKFVRSGTLGKITSAHVWANYNYTVLPPPVADAAPPAGINYDLWLGPAPARPFNPHRFHGSWRAFWDYGGGLVTDWGVHLMDIVLWALDIRTLPLRVLAAGGKYISPAGAHETPDTLAVTYQFANDFVMTWGNDALNANTDGRIYGLRLRGTKGYVVANRSGWEARGYDEKTIATSATGDGWANTPSLLAHTADFAAAVRARNPDTTCPPAAGALCAKYAHLGNIAVRSGLGALAYDDVRKTFDNPAANVWLRPEYRRPWTFPKP
jgi:predicted dehydrogenase